jgi:aryl carrier-like protein
VKLRGFRIELGEIEALLSQHPQVRETVVIAREDEPGNKRLVAYIVGEISSEEVTDKLRGFLEEKLPNYMVPSAFVMLEALPLTPNGKIDRRTLPAPDRTKLEHDSTFVSPITTAEKILADIWTQVLGVEKIGIHDNFFELGGDSIVSIKVIYQANQAGLRLTAQQLFTNQTIAKLAALAEPVGTIEPEQELETEQVPSAPIQQSTEAKHYTPSDFPQAQIAQKDLDKLMAKIHRGSEKN